MAINGRRAPPASSETKLNVWLNIAAVIAPLLAVVFGGMYWVGNFSATVKGQLDKQAADIDLKLKPLSDKVDAISGKVESTGKDAQARVDAATTVLSAKVDAATTLTQAKQDALAKSAELNQAEQQTFRASIQTGFTRLFDAQQKLADQINQERVDRLTEAAKKK